MGARVYIPGIGRFTAVDPIEGGVDNNYVYPTDPVNEYDLTGMIGWKKWFSDRRQNAWNFRNKVSYQANKHPRITDAVVLLVSRGSSRGGGGKRQSSLSSKNTSKLSYQLQARQLGFSKKANFQSHGQPVYLNKNGKQYISPDHTTHKGGAWKHYEFKNGEWRRTGTYDVNMNNRIGN